MLSGAWNAMSQDVIMLRTGEEVKAKVLEITPNEIKYKRFDNLEGPTITIEKSSVFMITYENGTKEVMKEQPQQGSTTQTDSKSDLWTTTKPRAWDSQYIRWASHNSVPSFARRYEIKTIL